MSEQWSQRCSYSMSRLDRPILKDHWTKVGFVVPNMRVLTQCFVPSDSISYADKRHALPSKCPSVRAA